MVQVKDAPIGEVMGAIRAVLDPWLGQARWKQTSRTVRFIYRFDSEDQPTIPLRLKIEINAVEPFSVFGFQDKNYTVENRWFSGSADLKTYSLDELMATKFRALYQRSKGRDLYDLWMAIDSLGVNCENILAAFHYYNEQQATKISRAEYEKNLHLKMMDQDFLSDAKQVLPSSAVWKPEEAYHVILSQLIKQLPGDPWKGINDDVDR